MTGSEFSEFCAVLADEDTPPAKPSLSLSGDNWREGGEAIFSAFGFGHVLKKAGDA